MTLQPVQRHSRRSARPALSTHVMPTNADAHDGWMDFLDAEGSSVESALCHVLARFGAPLRAAAVREAPASGGLDDRVADGGPVSDEQVGFPWVTPVVGSGCLSQPDGDQAEELRTLPARLVDALGELVEELGFLDVSSMVRDFASSLIQQRVQELRGAQFPESVPQRKVPKDESSQEREDRLSSENDEAIAARCVLAAALVHRAWHEGVADANAVVRHRDELKLPRDAAAAEDVRNGLLQPAARCLGDVVRRLKSNKRSKLRSTLRSIAALADRAENQARGDSPRLRGHDVDALTETAWLMLITPVGLYPGWHDLMTATALESSTHPKARGIDGAIDFARPRPPIVDLAHAGKLAASVVSLQEATQRSWRGRAAAEGAASDRVEFYDGLADLLVAQAGYGTDPQLVPAAFITSMDVELEMSLVRRLSALADEDEDFDARFTVLVPYHFLYGPHDSSHRAMLYWLSATIDTRGLDLGDEFDISKADIRWRDAQDTLTKQQHGIVVVRLVGSPLMPDATMQTPLRNSSTGDVVRGPINTLGARLRALAAATSGTNERQFRKDYPNESLLPAFMLDEYSGLHQMAAVVQGSLSSNLVNLGSDWIFRYWLCVGVQFDDVLVRLLLASHVDTSTGHRTLLEHHGVMVNRWVSNFDVDLLAWQGFDAVRSQCNDVTPDLHHYAAHMRFRDPAQPHPKDPEKTFTVTDRCHLGSVER